MLILMPVVRFCQTVTQASPASPAASAAATWATATSRPPDSAPTTAAQDVDVVRTLDDAFSFLACGDCGEIT